MRSSAVLMGLMMLVPAAGMAERVLEVEAVVEAPVAEVWNAWTTKEGLLSFFARDARIDVRPGGMYEILFSEGIGCNGCSVMAVQPQRMLSFTWNAPPHLAEVRPHFTQVVLRFQKVGIASTRLTLRQAGWGEGGQWDEAFEYFSRAWPTVLKNLQKRFAAGSEDE